MNHYDTYTNKELDETIAELTGWKSRPMRWFEHLMLIGNGKRIWIAPNGSEWFQPPKLSSDLNVVKIFMEKLPAKFHERYMNALDSICHDDEFRVVNASARERTVALINILQK